MNASDFIGKTIKGITDGTHYCIIEFTDGSKLEVAYFQSGWNGSECTLEYEFEAPTMMNIDSEY